MKKASGLLIFGAKNCKDLEYPNCYVGSLSRLVKADLNTLKSTADTSKSASLSANQIRSEHNMFVIRQKIKENQWFYDDKGYFSSYINPKIVKVSKDMEEDWEYCASFPWLRAKVSRYLSIQVEYEDEGLNTRKKTLDGFLARLFQHELDHLRGITLLNWRLNHLGLEFMDNEQTEDNKDILKTIEELKQKIAEIKVKYPNKFRRKLPDLNTQDLDGDNEYYFDMDKSREAMQILGFEEAIHEKMAGLFGRKLAFMNI